MAASLAPDCNEVKEKYDTCFLKWYSEKFLRGAGTKENGAECADSFLAYQKCLGAALKAKGLDTMLEEARLDNRENDAFQMRRSVTDRESAGPSAAALEGTGAPGGGGSVGPKRGREGK